MEADVCLSGRISRTKWWRGVLLLMVVSALAGRLAHGALIEIDKLHPELRGYDQFRAWLLTNLAETQPLARFLTVLIVLLALLSLWGFIALSAKRLHDRGLSMWWGLVITLPILVFMAGSLFSPNDDAQLGGGILLLGILLGVGCALLGILQFGVLKGVAGSNRFGPDPKGGGVGT